MCNSCGVEYGHALDCAAWWNDYRRDHFDDERVARYRRVAWLALTLCLGAWVAGARVVATGLLAVAISLLCVVIREQRKPIA